MAFSSMVLDVFDPVCDQTERRSKGSDGLVLSKGVWERFLKQIRICLLLSFSSSNSNQQSSQSFSSSSGARSKSHAMDITVSKLASGEISIFRLLAEDTLCFAELPDQVECAALNLNLGIAKNPFYL